MQVLVKDEPSGLQRVRSYVGTTRHERRYENDPTNRLCQQHHPWKLTPGVNIFHRSGGRCIWQELQERFDTCWREGVSKDRWEAWLF